MVDELSRAWRQLERFMFDRMMEAAVTKGVKEV